MQLPFIMLDTSSEAKQSFTWRDGGRCGVGGGGRGADHTRFAVFVLKESWGHIAFFLLLSVTFNLVGRQASIEPKLQSF